MTQWNGASDPESSQGARLSLDRRGALKAGIAACVSASGSTWATTASAQPTKVASGSPSTLFIASHPYPERSIVNKALQNTAAKIPGVLFKNLEAIYGDNLRGINVEAERGAYEGIRRVVFMFPTHWFNLTPMLKAYLNEVWTVWAPGALNGKEMLVVTTTGADAAAYTHEGKIGLTIEEVLAPMRASANYTGMTYLKPLAFLGVTNASPEMIRSYQQALSERLAEGLSAKR